MSQLRLPKGADAGFRIESIDAIECRFSINIYGAGRDGWFVASYRHYRQNQDSGVQQLPKGEWRTLLHLVEKCGYWRLPQDGSHVEDPTVTIEDGEGLTVEGREGERYHMIRRFNQWESGLGALLAFGRRVSGFFVRDPSSGFWIPAAPTSSASSAIAESESPKAENEQKAILRYSMNQAKKVAQEDPDH